MDNVIFIKIGEKNILYDKMPTLSQGLVKLKILVKVN